MSDLSTLSSELSRLTATATTATVRVHARRGPSSSGFVWRPGFVVTAEEAVEADEGIAVILPDGTKTVAALAGRDPSTDIALLRCDAATNPASLVSTPAAVGQLAVAVGSGRHGALAALAMVSSVAGPWQSQRGGQIDQYIGLDMTFDRRLEGALLVGADGGHAGMVVAGPRHTHLAIPAATIERVASQLQAHGRIPRGYLGLGLQPVEIPPLAGSSDKRHGLMVVSVDTAGPGQTAGMLQGDVITAWNGEPLTSVHGLMRRLGSGTVGQTADIALMRAGTPANVRLTIADRPTT